MTTYLISKSQQKYSRRKSHCTSTDNYLADCTHLPRPSSISSPARVAMATIPSRL